MPRDINCYCESNSRQHCPVHRDAGGDTVKRGTNSAPLQSRRTSADIDTQVWFSVESSRIGENDWFALSDARYDTAVSARERIKRWTADIRDDDEFEYRIVRKRLTSEVVV